MSQITAIYHCYTLFMLWLKDKTIFTNITLKQQKYAALMPNLQKQTIIELILYTAKNS